MTTDQLVFVFGLLGNMASFMVLLAPLPTFYIIFKKRSTEGFQSVPYIIGLFNAMLWLYYAYLKTNMTLLITISIVSCFVYAAYICFFLFFAPKNTKVNTLKLLLLLNVASFGLIVLITYLVTHGSNRMNIVGRICLVLSLCVFIAPLCILRKVIRSRSVEYMPFLPLFFLNLSAVVWFLYGFFLKDYNLIIPNAMGFGLGVIQMAFHLMYKYAKKDKEDPTEIKEVMKLNVITVGIIPIAIALADGHIDLGEEEGSVEQAIQIM